MTKIKGRWYKWIESQNNLFKYVRACDFDDDHIHYDKVIYGGGSISEGINAIITYSNMILVKNKEVEDFYKEKTGKKLNSSLQKFFIEIHDSIKKDKYIQEPVLITKSKRKKQLIIV